MGLLGIIGGGLMILLSLGDIATLITKHFLSIFAVCFFVIGIQSYLTWRWKWKLFLEFNQSAELVTSILTEISTEIGKTSMVQQDDASTLHSHTTQGNDGR
jgi:uncharacterized membrane-anchored protein